MSKGESDMGYEMWDMSKRKNILRKALLPTAYSLLSALCSLLFAFTSLTCSQHIHIGAEVLVDNKIDLLYRNRRVGIICNHTSVFADGTHLVDSLIGLGVKVTALFGPEHGIRGVAAAGDSVSNAKDAKTGLPIYSLYGKTRKPTPEMLRNVDLLLFDIQDVGARFYTYASTMAYAMEAAAENGKVFIVLDRPNPVNGTIIEGPVLDTAYKSFIGMFPLPVRHGITLGELAKMIVGERWMKHSNVDLEVIPMEGWQRGMWYDQTGLPWIPPSPNMKTLSTATVYPGTCLFEGTNVTEGRGTDKPFEYIGAPWINGKELADAMNRLRLPAVTFEQISFTPIRDSVAAPNPKFEDKLCEGVYIHVTNRDSFQSVQTGLALLSTINQLYHDSLVFNNSSFDRLIGVKGIRNLLQQNTFTPEQRDEFTRRSLEEYEAIRVKYLLY